MRLRILVLGATVAALVAAALVLLVPDGPEGPREADRAALARALTASAPGRNLDDAAVALERVAALAAGGAPWTRLVAGGGADVAALLDRAQPALGLSEDRVEQAAAVVEPLVEGRPVDDEVLDALGRWTWPLLAADVADGPARARATRVLTRADAGDDERDAVAAGVALARVHRTLSSEPDGAEALRRWRADLAAAAVDGDAGDLDARTAALLDGEGLDQPAPVVLRSLAAWGRPPPRPTDGAREAIAGGDLEAPARMGSALTVASYLAVVDATGDRAAAATLTRLAAGDDPLTADRADLVALEDALLSTDDPALAATTEAATLLLSA